MECCEQVMSTSATEVEMIPSLSMQIQSVCFIVTPFDLLDFPAKQRQILIAVKWRFGSLNFHSNPIYYPSSVPSLRGRNGLHSLITQQIQRAVPTIAVGVYATYLRCEQNIDLLAVLIGTLGMCLVHTHTVNIRKRRGQQRTTANAACHLPVAGDWRQSGLKE